MIRGFLEENLATGSCRSGKAQQNLAFLDNCQPRCPSKNINPGGRISITVNHEQLNPSNKSRNPSWPVARQLIPEELRLHPSRRGERPLILSRKYREFKFATV